jgi:hypothetical protein
MLLPKLIEDNFRLFDSFIWSDEPFCVHLSIELNFCLKQKGVAAAIPVGFKLLTARPWRRHSVRSLYPGVNKAPSQIYNNGSAS